MAMAKTPSLKASTRPVSFTLELSAYAQTDCSAAAGGSYGHASRRLDDTTSGAAARQHRSASVADGQTEGARDRDVNRIVVGDHRRNHSRGRHLRFRQSAGRRYG